MRTAEIKFKNVTAGILKEDEAGYHFQYDGLYLKSLKPEAISLTMPLREMPYSSIVLFPFFDGLIPEGWLLDVAERNWKLSPRDRMGLLLACCKECIGAVSVHPLKNEA
jgi:serine/threonine-protein kinase HipA